VYLSLLIALLDLDMRPNSTNLDFSLPEPYQVVCQLVVYIIEQEKENIMMLTTVGQEENPEKTELMVCAGNRNI